MSTDMMDEFERSNQFTLAQYIRMIFALPLVKVDGTLRGFQYIKTVLPNQYSTPKFAAFRAEVKYLDYVNENYVGTNYKPPKYPHYLCNLHNRVAYSGNLASVRNWDMPHNAISLATFFCMLVLG